MERSFPAIVAALAQFAGIFGQVHPTARRFGRKRSEAKHYISASGYGS
jgi:hypothetical protein